MRTIKQLSPYYHRRLLLDTLVLQRASRERLDRPEVLRTFIFVHGHIPDFKVHLLRMREFVCLDGRHVCQHPTGLHGCYRAHFVEWLVYVCKKLEIGPVAVHRAILALEAAPPMTPSLCRVRYRSKAYHRCLGAAILHLTAPSVKTDALLCATDCAELRQDFESCLYQIRLLLMPWSPVQFTRYEILATMLDLEGIVAGDLRYRAMALATSTLKSSFLSGWSSIAIARAIWHLAMRSTHGGKRYCRNAGAYTCAPGRETTACDRLTTRAVISFVMDHYNK